MANELSIQVAPGYTVYFLIRNATNQIWNGVTFASYVTANYSTYPIAATQQGSSSGYYVASFPAGITAAGVYNVVAHAQVGGSPAETDPSLGGGDFNWNGVSVSQLSDAATSGQIAGSLPIPIYRGQQVLNFLFPLVSSTDHITAFTSGVVSGQISKNGNPFTVLQSGAFTEVGLGFYSLQALTSGDTLCNTMGLVFTGVGISGGTSDPRRFSIVLQRVSGQ